MLLNPLHYRAIKEEVTKWALGGDAYSVLTVHVVDAGQVRDILYELNSDFHIGVLVGPTPAAAERASRELNETVLPLGRALAPVDNLVHDQRVMLCRTEEIASPDIVDLIQVAKKLLVITGERSLPRMLWRFPRIIVSDDDIRVLRMAESYPLDPKLISILSEEGWNQRSYMTEDALKIDAAARTLATALRGKVQSDLAGAASAIEHEAQANSDRGFSDLARINTALARFLRTLAD